LAPYKNSDTFDRSIEGLTKAGLEGDPKDYFKIIDKNKLNGDEIKELLLNQNMKIGGKVFGFKWAISLSSTGECEYAIYGKKHEGKYWVDGDTLCYKFETLYHGMPYCGEIFKNQEKDKNPSGEYAYLTEFMLFPFSVIE
jgi:hypothetical protein